MSDELEPCPYCGSKQLESGKIRKRYDPPNKIPNMWFISCTDCPNQGILADSWEQAKLYWNTRNIEKSTD